MLHSIGDIRVTSVDTVVYARQLEANRAEPCAYKGRTDLNEHIPKWTYPLVYYEDYARFADWLRRCREHGYEKIEFVEV